MPGYLSEFPVVLSKRFSATRFWDMIRKYEVTNFNLLGSMPQYLLKQPKRANDRENKVWRVNSAACPKELIEDFEKRFDVKMYEGYGAVDGGGFSITTFGKKNPPVGTMGKPDVSVTAEIIDDEYNILEPDEVGELVFLVKNLQKIELKKDQMVKNGFIQETLLQKIKMGGSSLSIGKKIQLDGKEKILRLSVLREQLINTKKF
jgi:crotonobetaine/carnitine-CoA ligase